MLARAMKRGSGVAVVDGDVGWGPAGLGRNVDEVGMFDAEALAAVCGDGEGAKADWVGQLGEFFSGHRESICSCAQTCAQGRDLFSDLFDGEADRSSERASGDFVDDAIQVGFIHGEVIWRNFCLRAQAKPERSYLRFWFVEVSDCGVGDVREVALGVHNHDHAGGCENVGAFGVGDWEVGAIFCCDDERREAGGFEQFGEIFAVHGGDLGGNLRAGMVWRHLGVGLVRVRVRVRLRAGLALAY